MEPELLAQLMAGGGPPMGGPPPGAGMPPQAPPEPAPSPGGGSTESLIRQMIDLGRQVIDNEDTDPAEMAAVEQVTTMLQKLVATRHGQDQKAMGVTPQMQSMRRAYA